MTPVRKYNFLDSFLFCFVYKIFAVLYLRIRLFALLTAGKGNGTGVYVEISFPEFYNFFLFILFSFYFSFTFYLPTPAPTTHDPRPTTHDPRPTPTTHDLYPRHLATLGKNPLTRKTRRTFNRSRANLNGPIRNIFIVFLLKPIRDNLAPGFPRPLVLSPLHAQKSSGSRLGQEVKCYAQ